MEAVKKRKGVDHAGGGGSKKRWGGGVGMINKGVKKMMVPGLK